MNATEARALAENNTKAKEILESIFEKIKQTAEQNGFEVSLNCYGISYNENVVNQVKNLLEKEKFKVSYEMKRTHDPRGEGYDTKHMVVKW